MWYNYNSEGVWKYGKYKKGFREFVGCYTLILCVPNVVKAEQTLGTQSVMSEEFKSYLNWNLEFEIKAVKPKTEEENPKTGDSILWHVATGIIS